MTPNKREGSKGSRRFEIQRREDGLKLPVVLWESGRGMQEKRWGSDFVTFPFHGLFGLPGFTAPNAPTAPTAPVLCRSSGSTS